MERLRHYLIKKKNMNIKKVLASKTYMLTEWTGIWSTSRTFSQLIEKLKLFFSHEFGCDWILIGLYDSERDEFEYVHPPQPTGLHFLPEEGPAGRAIHKNSVFIAQTLEEFQKFYPLYDALGRPCSIVALPLRCREQLLGSIELAFKTPPKNEWKDLLPYFEAMTPLLGLLLDDFRLFEKSSRITFQEEKLAEVSEKISSSLDMDELLDTITEALHTVISCEAVGIFLLDRDATTIQRMVVYGYSKEVEQSRILELGRSVNELVRRSGRALIFRDLSKQPAYARVTSNTHSAMLVPIMSNLRRIGVFVLESSTPDAYSAADLELFQRFSQQAALSIEKARLYQALLDKNRLEKELSIAREIQTSFLPLQAPELPGIDMAGLNIPSRLVSGDYYDYIKIVDGQWGLVIGDVSGKGIPAALIMASFRASLLAEIRNNYAISVIMSKVSQLLWESTSSHQFVTAFYGVLDLQKSLLTYSNAGHNPGLILHPDGSITSLETGGLVLGAFPDTTFQESFIGLTPGDLLVLYTDGVTEIYSEEGEEFGVERLQKLAEAHRNLTSREISLKIKEEILNFAPDHAIQDDFTLLILKVLPA
jgi:phosphoserine phosphatase RsbU/P